MFHRGKVVGRHARTCSASHAACSRSLFVSSNCLCLAINNLCQDSSVADKEVASYYVQHLGVCRQGDGSIKLSFFVGITLEKGLDVLVDVFIALHLVNVWIDAIDTKPYGAINLKV